MRAGDLWQPEQSRRIRKRIVVTGQLELVTPAHLGNGDGDEQVDLPLLRETTFASELGDERPILTGASLAGALRSYLRCREQGWRQAENATVVGQKGQPGLPPGAAERLFGGRRGDDAGLQSPLVVDDAVAESGGVERRDGVKIDADRRAAADQTKFDVELWQAGTTFPLCFELLVMDPPQADPNAAARWSDEETLKQALATALDGLAKGEIALGMRKSRGYGKVKVANWTVTEYELSKTDGLLAWLAAGRNVPGYPGATVKEGTCIFTALDVKPGLDDRRDRFVIKATFGIDGSLLIRSGSGVREAAPDTVHLRSHRPGGDQPIVSGTALAGAVRARALRIANTLAGGPGQAAALIDDLFGVHGAADGQSAQSRVVVEEEVIDGGQEELVQSRITIDRFTGGVLDGRLFSEQPVFGQPEQTWFEARLELRDPADHEIGLLLQVLKDLWCGDLPIGGEQSVGRGRLQGRDATLTEIRNGETRTWVLAARGKRGVDFSGDAPQAELEKYATALSEHFPQGVTA